MGKIKKTRVLKIVKSSVSMNAIKVISFNNIKNIYLFL